MRVVVTGGAGFIGANLVQRMSASSAFERICVFDDLSAGDGDRLAGLDDVDLVDGSILDPDALAHATSGAGAVVHLAALVSVPESVSDPVRYHDVNVTGTLRVLEAARAVNAHTIVASSAAVYGTAPPLPTPETAASAPQSVYASSKLAAEAHAFAYAGAYDLPVLVLRFFNVFGPLQDAHHSYAAAIPAFIAGALDRRPLTIHGDGRQSRDMVSVNRVVTVLTDAVQRRVTHDRPVNLAGGVNRTLLDIIAGLEAAIGRPVERHHTPPRAGDVRHSHADITLLRRLFPDLPPQDFASDLSATVEWSQRRHTASTGNEV